MLSLFNVGDVLKDRYEIVDVFGSFGETAAYLATDRANKESLLLWASSTVFRLGARPPGAREYFVLDGSHYLAIHLDGRTLGLILAAAGRLQAKWAVQWLVEMCTDVGHWHDRRPEPLVCLRGGSLCLSAWRLTEEAHAVISFYRDVNQPASILTPVDEYCFSAPEQELQQLSPRSDVYAMGSLFYCLLSGEMPPDAASLGAGRGLEARLHGLVPDLAPELAKVILKAMDPDPGRRYATAGEMARDLERFLDKSKVDSEGKKAPFMERMLPWSIGIIVLGTLFIAVNVLLPGGWLSRRSRTVDEPTVVASSTPGVALTATRAPAPLPAPTESPTPSPALTLLVNQVRLDQFPQIVVYADVLDSNQLPVYGLSPDRFYVRQDGVDVPDVQLASVSADHEPLSVIFAVDISSSMNGEPLQRVSSALAAFVATLDPSDEVGLVEFDDEVALVQPLTGSQEALRAAIEALAAHEDSKLLWGDTALYDAMALSVQQLAGAHSRTAVVVLADGFDTASREYTPEEVLALANQAGTPLYIIGLGNVLFRFGLAERLGTDSGGAFFFASGPDALDGRYRRIRELLQGQYRLAFTSRHGADGGSHNLAIRVRIDGAQEAWVEKEYLAPQ